MSVPTANCCLTLIVARHGGLIGLENLGGICGQASRPRDVANPRTGKGKKKKQGDFPRKTGKAIEHKSGNQ